MIVAAPRLERADLRVMDAYPGEHYPVEVDVVVGERVGGCPIETGRERQLRCGCTDALENNWPHG